MIITTIIYSVVLSGKSVNLTSIPYRYTLFVVD